jgi:hypothetical protein
MYIKRLSENFVQKALLIFEILSFEVYCRSDSDSGVGDSLYQRYADSLSRGVVFQIRISPRIAVGYYAKKI